MPSISIQMLTNCDFECDHCMFYCGGRRGKHMSDETIDKIGEFIRLNNITGIALYGGEPFLDIKYFEKCLDAWYEPHMSLFITSNGSFVNSPKKYKWFINEFLAKIAQRNYEGEAGVQVRISADKFHKQHWDDKMENRIRHLCNMAKNPDDYWYDIPDLEDNYEENPFYFEGKQMSSFIYLDELQGNEWVNPVGRAAETGCYTRNKDCNCFITSIMYPNIEDDYSLEETLNDNLDIDVNGNIGFCCCADSGNIGNISEYYSMDGVKQGLLDFRQQFRKKHKTVGCDSKMLETCTKCVKFKMKVNVYAT